MHPSSTGLDETSIKTTTGTWNQAPALWFRPDLDFFVGSLLLFAVKTRVFLDEKIKHKSPTNHVRQMRMEQSTHRCLRSAITSVNCDINTLLVITTSCFPHACKFFFINFCARASIYLSCIACPCSGTTLLAIFIHLPCIFL